MPDPRRVLCAITDDAPGYPGSIAAWPSTGYLLADCGRDLVVWDPDTAALITRVRHGATAPEGQPLLKIAVDDDTGMVALAHGVHDFALWSLDRMARQRVFAGHGEQVRAVVFADDAMVSGSGDGTVRSWDRARGAGRATLAIGPTYALARHPTADVIAACGAEDTAGRITLLDDREVARTIRVPLAPLPDHAPLADEHRRRLGAAASRRDARITCAAWSPDGRHLVTGGHDFGVTLVDAATGALVRTWHGHAHWVTAVAVTADGARVVSASTDGHVRVWDATSDACLVVHPALPAAALALHLRDDRIVAGCADGWIYEL